MKKLNLLIVLALFIGIFSSCKKDTTTLPAPVISFLNGVSTANVASGANYTIAGTITSDEGLTEVKYFVVTTSGETQIGQAITSFTNANSYSFQQTISNITAQSVIKVQATDSKNQTTSANFTITVGGTNNPTVYSNVTIGSYNNTTLGSSFASIDGTVYSLANAKASSNKIDMIYYFSSANNASISAPADLTLLNVYFTTASAPSTWTVKNNTKLLKVNGSITYATATSAQISALNPTGLNVNNLVAGDVIAFLTDATSALPNKKGIAEVVSVTGTDAGQIVLNIKIAN